MSTTTDTILKEPERNLVTTDRCDPYWPKEGGWTSETIQLFGFYAWVDASLWFTNDGATIPYRTLYEDYKEFVKRWQTTLHPSIKAFLRKDVVPISRPAFSILLPAYSLSARRAEVRRTMKNKIVLFEGVRWQTSNLVTEQGVREG